MILEPIMIFEGKIGYAALLGNVSPRQNQMDEMGGLGFSPNLRMTIVRVNGNCSFAKLQILEGYWRNARFDLGSADVRLSCRCSGRVCDAAKQ